MSDETSPIVNCDWQFSFQCPQQWGQLAPTEGENVRMCGTCLKHVYLCSSDEEIGEHAELGHCIAVGGEVRGDYDDGPLLGVLEPTDE